MRRIGLSVLAAAVLFAGCDTGADDGAEEVDPGVAGTSAPDTVTRDLPGMATEPADGSVVSATLNEWTIVLSRDTVDAGPVSFRIRNAGTVVHRLEVEGQGEEVVTDDLQPGGEITMSLTLQPGTYEVYCPITAGGQSHAELGMRTQLHVR